MKQLLVKAGGVVIEEVPPPQVSPKSILVAVRHSCVSVGTELSGVKMSGLPLYQRALKQPENVKRVLGMVRDQGWKRTMDRVRGKLAAGTPTGYSAAGIVVGLGEEVEGFSLGDRVACAGAGIANHAEWIDVPVNLAVKIPEGMGTAEASTVTLGAIALQGVRRAAPTLGEVFVVIGLGILGQLTAQMLAANGCRVIGVDLDAARINAALGLGLTAGINPKDENYIATIHRYSDGLGADGVIITAASPSHQIISEAMQACRRKGRVVLVGDVGLNLQRADFYRKELDFLISTSYGPGRYDPLYEEGGQDYPLPYVRWTENRNMQAYLALLAKGSIKLEGLPRQDWPLDKAGEAYAALAGEGEKPLLALLSYPERPSPISKSVWLSSVGGKDKAERRTRPWQVALAGASSFAQGMHLPNLAKLGADFHLRAVMSRTGANAKAVAGQYQADYATTDFLEILQDAAVDVVLIATRHNLHGPMTLEALRAGKAVLVEKPLTLTVAELEAISQFYQDNPQAPLLMVGYNRRFSPAMQVVKRAIANRTTPLIVNYRMNAGYIPLDHWVHGPEGGGRNLGEACHIYDLFTYLTDGAEVVKIEASAINPTSRQWAKNDNFIASISFADGSVCSLTYSAMGEAGLAKERMEIFADGKAIVMDDYKTVVTHGSRAKSDHYQDATSRKGQFEELQALANALREEGDWPIPLQQLMIASQISLSVETIIRGA